MKMPVDFALDKALEDLQKHNVNMNMKEVYYKNLNERAQRLKRHNEEVVKCMRDIQE